jgi:hypothetical protein
MARAMLLPFGDHAPVKFMLCWTKYSRPVIAER